MDSLACIEKTYKYLSEFRSDLRNIIQYKNEKNIFNKLHESYRVYEFLDMAFF